MVSDANEVAVYYVKVFSTHPANGNLAGVVPHADGLEAATMQAIATKVGASETVFIFPSEKADLQLRWFTPNTEVGLCVHATIAALGTLTKLNQLEKDTVSIKTKNAILKGKLIDGDWFIYVDNYKSVDRAIDLQLLQKYLGIESSDIIRAPGIMQVFDDFELIVPVKSLDILKRLNPDIDRYADLCNQLEITGISVVTPDTFDKSHHFHTREFAPLYGYLEDPLCGMCAGAIISYLGITESQKLIEVEQGNFLNSPGIIKIIPNQNGLWIGGSNVVYQVNKINPL